MRIKARIGQTGLGIYTSGASGFTKVKAIEHTKDLVMTASDLNFGSFDRIDQDQKAAGRD